MILLCLMAFAVKAATPQYTFDVWSTENGLPQNGLSEITQTPDGYLWFTTYDGLVRYDGVRFTTFNRSNTLGIVNNRFTHIFADTDGTIYASTTEGGNLTIMRDGIFSSYSADVIPGHYIAKIAKGTDGTIKFLSEDKDREGRTWYSFDGNAFHRIESEPKPNDGIQFDAPDGAHWRMDIDGVTETRNGVSTKTPIDLGRLSYTASHFIDSEGALWIGEESVYRIKNGQYRKFSEQDGMPATTVYHSFWQESDGSVWFSSGGASTNGIGLIQVKDDTVKIWNDGIKDFPVSEAFVDREGTAWMATSRGLARRRRQIIDAIATQSGVKGNEIYPIFRDSKGTIWVGSTVGLSIVKDGFLQPVDITNEDPKVEKARQWLPQRMSVQSLWEDAKGQLWVGVNGGLFVVKDNKARMVYLGSHFFAIKGTKDGHVWTATNKGLIEFADEKPVAEYNTTNGLPNEFMTVIFEDSHGTLWFGGYGGVSRIENGRFVNLTSRDGLVGDHVRTIFEDRDGVLWFGTYDQGLSRFKDGRFSNYDIDEGLFSSGVFAIEEDDAGAFWITSNQGIYKIRKQELNDLADGLIGRVSSISYGKSDGMLSNECNGGRQPASFRDDEGRFWFPTQMGVAIVDPDAEKPNLLAPNVAFEEILADRHRINFSNTVSIEPGIRDLEIHFTGISLIRSDQIKFQYKLEGHDTDWIDADVRRMAFYSNVPPGTYTFWVKAVNSDGVWSEQPSSLRIQLEPYFYQTRLFLLLSVLAAALLLLIIWKISVYQLEAREKKLMRLVAERTDALARANDDLRSLANSDVLTKIGNRRRFDSFLSDEWNRAYRFKTEISLILIDIDHFKIYNDTYGHQAGDSCLQRVAEALTDTVKRPSDLVARFGGEEFAIILGATDSEGAVRIANQAIENLRAMSIEHKNSTTSQTLTVSAGIATLYVRSHQSEAELVKAADQALYKAKENGRNRIFVYDEISQGLLSSVPFAREGRF